MKLALGTAQFGMQYGIVNKNTPIEWNEADSILGLAKEFSIDTIDTASIYGNSEKILGKANLNSFKVNTKLKAIPNFRIDIFSWVEKEIQCSLNNLNIDRIDTLFIHNPIDLQGSNGFKLFEAVNLAKEKGLLKKIGISIYSPEELSFLFDNFYFDVVQAPFNLVDRRILQSGWLKKLSAMNVIVHTRSAFLQGLLLTPFSELDKKFKKVVVFSAWRDWLQKNNLNPLDVALAYPLSINEIDRVIVGVDSLLQFKEILDATTFISDYTFPKIESSDIKLLHPGNWQSL